MVLDFRVNTGLRDGAFQFPKVHIFFNTAKFDRKIQKMSETSLFMFNHKHCVLL